MKVYTEFHGDISIKEIGRELRKIVKLEKNAFKIMTGYGSTTGISLSKAAALRSLSNMKKEGIIKGYFPGEVKTQILMPYSPFYTSKLEYERIIKNDSDYGNEGIIFIFIK